MAIAERVRIRFLEIIPKRSLQKMGSGRFIFFGVADFVQFGHSKGKSTGNVVELDLRQGLPSLDLQGAGWTYVFASLKDVSKLKIELKGSDSQNKKIKIGSISREFSPKSHLPAEAKFHGCQGVYEDTCRHFSVRYTIEPEANETFSGEHSEFTTLVAARVTNPGCTEFTTLVGDRLVSRVEICPVRPVPPNPITRPAFPVGTRPAVEELAVHNLTPTDPINSIKNPAFIPIQNTQRVSDETASRLEVTYYRPNNLNLTDDDTRLVWEATPANKIKFLNGNNKGLKVFVYGTSAGGYTDVDVTFSLKLSGVEVASYRAVVGIMKKVTCRFNILRGPDSPSNPGIVQPRSTPEMVENQVKLCNIFFRQVGLQLKLDTNTATNPENIANHPPVVASAKKGIFTINVPGNQTRNVSSNNFVGFPYNYRQNVLNFQYIKTSADGSLGWANAWPHHPLAPNPGDWQKFDFVDNGTPSTSWIPPTGLPPDGPSGNITLKVVTGIPSPPAHANLFGMILTDACGDPTTDAGAMNYGGIMAHEIGHMLNLGHRIEDPDPTMQNGTWHDQLTFPPNQNIMHWNEPTSRAQDLDIIQAKALRQSVLVT